MSQLQVTGEAKIRDIQGPVVANNGVVTALDGAASQYVRGDGTLADFPTSSGGGSSVSYYLNSSVSQGTIGGVAYRQLSKEPIIGAGTDITISANGYVANYLTDANDPDVILVPGGNFNCEFYFSVNNNTGNPTTYAELYKYDGTTFTLLGSSVGVPESINQGTTIAPYYFAIPVATATLALTDRLAIRIYVNVDGRTVTLHTENSHLCQVVTTLSKGMVSLNNLTDQSQFITTGTSGTDFNIVSSGDTHTFNIPSASASNRGLITTGTQTIAGSKTFSATTLLNSIYVDGVSYLKTQTTTSYIAGYTTFSAKANGVIEYYFPSSFKSILDFNDSGDYTYTFPALNGTLALLEGTQTFTGAKTFNLATNNESGIRLKNGFGASATGYTGLGADANQLWISVTAATHIFDFPSTTGRTYSFPDASGTLALTSNLSSYVPYTGATANVNLGLYAITSDAARVIGDNSTYGGVFSIKQSNVIGGLLGTGYTELIAKSNRLGISVGTGAISYLSLSLLTAERTFTFPDASGTIAVTSDLSSYVPYTGATTNVDLGIRGLFAGYLQSDGLINVKYQDGNIGAGVSYGTLGLQLNQFFLTFSQPSTSTKQIFNFPTTSRTYTMPNATGTIALTSDIPSLSGYVPYTGATGAVDLGNYDLTVYGIKVGRGAGSISTNIVLGASALSSNTTGSINTSIGTGSLQANTTGSANTAIGNVTLNSNLTGQNNTAIGNTALSMTTSSYNTGIGAGSLANNTSGSYNTGLGYGSGSSITTGSYNVIIGSYTGTSGMSNNIVLADGQGNIRYQWNGTTNSFTGSGTFSSIVGVNGASEAGWSLKSNGNAKVEGTNGTTVLQVNDTSTGGKAWSLISAGAGNAHSVPAGTFYLRNSSDGVTTLQIASTGAATFSSSVESAGQIKTTFAGQSISINAASPNSVRIQLQNNSIGNSGVCVENSTGGDQFSGTSAYSMAIGTFTARDLFLGTNSVARLMVTSGGAVLVGNTSSRGYVFEVNSNSGVYAMEVRQNTSTASAWAMTVVHEATSGTRNMITFNSGGYGQAGSITSGNTTTSFNTSSDYRLKQDLKDYNGLSLVSAIKTYDFEWKADNSRMYGVMAHELQDVIPYAVVGEKDDIDEDGKPIMQGVDYSKLVPVLVKAIQELNAKVTALENK